MRDFELATSSLCLSIFLVLVWILCKSSVCNKSVALTMHTLNRSGSVYLQIQFIGMWKETSANQTFGRSITILHTKRDKWFCPEGHLTLEICDTSRFLKMWTRDKYSQPLLQLHSGETTELATAVKMKCKTFIYKLLHEFICVSISYLSCKLWEYKWCSVDSRIVIFKVHTFHLIFR